MAFTVDDARRYLLALMPPGFDELYDLTPGVGDVWKLFDAFGEAFKTYVFDPIDTLRRELFPPTCDQKLPDWEAATGISSLAPALFGTKAQRQQALVSKLREAGPWCDPVVESVLGPALGYRPTTVPRIIKTSRAGLDAAHTYSGGALAVAHGTTVDSAQVKNHDGGKISLAGVRLYLTLAAPLPTDAAATVTLKGPDYQKTWTPATDGATTSYVLFGAEFAGHAIAGDPWWQLEVVNPSAATDISITEWHFIVEGIAPNQETGGAIFAWGVYADPAHLAESGVPADLTAARAAIARIEHSEADGALILAIGPNPDDTNTIPDAFVPG